MTTRPMRLILAAAALVLVVAACSDDSDSSSDTTEQPPISTGIAACDDADIEAAIPPGSTLDSYECDQGWAAISYTTDGGSEVTSAYQAEGQFWIAMPCDADGIPDSILEAACS